VIAVAKVISEKRAIELIRDKGRRLAQMHTRHGVKWFLIPGGEVSEQTATHIREMPQVVASGDALFPGLSQTWRFA
jgi:hypothetical protein